MKQHLSQRPHQWSSRQRLVDVERAVTAAERVVVLGQRGEPPGHPEFAERAQRGEVPEVRAEGAGQHAAEGRLERPALGVLVVDRHAVHFQRRDRRGPLVRHDHGVPAVERRGQHGDGRDDAGHRDVAVEESQLTRTQQLRVDLALGAQDGQPGDGRGPFDGLEPVPGQAHDEQCGLGPLADHLDGDDRVDAAAERHQGAAGLRGPGGRPGGRGRSAGRDGPSMRSPDRSSPFR